MICKNCGTEYEGIFCPECGTNNEGVAFAAEEKSQGTEASLTNEEIVKKLQEIEFYYQHSQNRKEGTKENATSDYYDRGQTIALTMLRSAPRDYRVWWAASKPIDFWNTDESIAPAETDFNKLYFDKALELADINIKKQLINEVDSYRRKKKQRLEKEKKAEQELEEAEKKRKTEHERIRIEQEEAKRKATEERIAAEKQAQIEREQSEKKRKEAEIDLKNRIVGGIEFKTLEEATAMRKANKMAVASLVCGILVWVTLMTGFLPLVLSVASFILSIKALKRKTQKRKSAIWGLVLPSILIGLIIIAGSLAFILDDGDVSGSITNEINNDEKELENLKTETIGTKEASLDSNDTETAEDVEQQGNVKPIEKIDLSPGLYDFHSNGLISYHGNAFLYSPETTDNDYVIVIDYSDVEEGSWYFDYVFRENNNGKYIFMEKDGESEIAITVNDISNGISIEIVKDGTEPFNFSKISGLYVFHQEKLSALPGETGYVFSDNEVRLQHMPTDSGIPIGNAIPRGQIVKVITTLECENKDWARIIYNDLIGFVPLEVVKSKEEMKAQYILQFSDRKYYSSNELSGLTKEQLELARQEIYARHGLIFKDKKLAEYFSQFDWYYPTQRKVKDSELNNYEEQNLTTIKLLESVR